MTPLGAVPPPGAVSPVRRGRGAGAWGVLAAAAALGGCLRRAPPEPPPAPAHYVVGAPWSARGVWHYPAERFAYVATGLAAIATRGAGTTADGERYDPAALAAAHATLQLPAVLRVTDLETGRAVLVRVDDRGPEDPGRLLALTPHAAAVLGIAPGGVAQVRVEEDAALSHALADSLHGGPRLDIATAPREAVRAEALPPPGAGAGVGSVAAAGTIGPAPEPAAAAAPPIPQDVTQGSAQPGRLWLRTDSFGRPEYARRQAALLGGAEVQRSRQGRSESYAVRAGPFEDVAAADAALARALAAGVTDARIVVE